MRPEAAVYVALFTALTALSAFIRIPLPLVPVTLQTAVVILSGIVLGARYGALSQTVYVSMGLIGFPIFAKGGGLAYLEQPSFGFLAGFIPAAWVSGHVAGSWRKSSLPRIFGASLAGLVLIYIAGASFMYWYFFPVVQQKDLAMMQVLKIGVFPFVPLDLLKILLLLPIITILKRREHLMPELG